MKQHIGLANVRIEEVVDRAPHMPLSPVRALITQVCPDGLLLVSSRAGQSWHCECLISGVDLLLQTGDEVLVLPPDRSDSTAIVLGRVGRYVDHAPQPRVTIEATESLTLKCGASSIDLQADGKVMIRGEDVLVRAKGTQRIRAGTVSIN